MKNVALPSTSASAAAASFFAFRSEHVQPFEPEPLVVDRVRELVGERDPFERRGRLAPGELQLAAHGVVVADHLARAIALVRIPQARAIGDHADRVPRDAPARELPPRVGDVGILEKVAADLLLRNGLGDHPLGVAEPVDLLDLSHHLRDERGRRPLGPDLRTGVEVGFGHLTQALGGGDGRVRPLRCGRRHLGRGRYRGHGRRLIGRRVAG
jgi:hypothetical protein